MNKKLNKILSCVCGEIFQSSAFMLPMPEAQAEQETTENGLAVVVSVRFSGPFSGTLFLGVSAGMLPELAANMLGVDEGDDAPPLAKQQDALKELANMICGNILPRIAGVEAEFNVYAPQLTSGQPVPRDDGDSSPIAQTRMLLDSGVAELALVSEGPGWTMVSAGASPEDLCSQESHYDD